MILYENQYSDLFLNEVVAGDSDATKLLEPVGINFAPDGRIFIMEKKGTIKIINSNGEMNPNNWIDIRDEVNSRADRGMIAMAFHPQFESKKL